MLRVLVSLGALFMGVLSYGQVAQERLYEFSGYCVDCGQSVTGVLTLTGEQPGVGLTAGNIVSLAYDGSNLLAPFVETNPAVVVGSLSGAAAQAADLQLGFDTYVFVMSSDGSWDISYAGPISGGTGNDGGIDNGINGLLTVVEPVPEPASAVLLAGTIAAAAVLRRPRVRITASGRLGSQVS